MKGTWKRIGSLFLAVCMVLTMLSMTSFAQVGGIIPQMGGIIPQMGGIIPQMGGIIPQMGGIIPQVGGIIPQVGGIIPGAQFDPSGTNAAYGAPLYPSGTNAAYGAPDTGASARTAGFAAPQDQFGTMGAMGTMGASAPASTAGDAIALPVPGDVLEIQGGVIKDGIVTINMGDYDEFLADVQDGIRFPITINRPKGAEAVYSVSATVGLWNGSDENGFKIFNSPTGTEYEDYCDILTFGPGETSKTIYIGEPYSFGDNMNNIGELSNYITFYEFGKTTMNVNEMRLVTSKTTSAGAVYEENIIYAEVNAVSGFDEPGRSKAVKVDFQADTNKFYDIEAYCRVTDDLQLTLSNGTQTLSFSPAEAVDSVLSSVTFIIPPDAIGNGEGWQVISIDNIKDAKEDSIVDLSIDDMDVSSYTLKYSYDDPVFGTITTDKEEYYGLETIHAVIPVENPVEFGFDNEEYGMEYWNDQFGLSYDGGKSFIDGSLFSWDSDTSCIEVAFPAPVNDTGSNITRVLEIYRCLGEFGGEESESFILSRGIYGAYKLIDILSETTDFVPIESITVTGMPGSVIPADKIDDTFPIQVQIKPSNATIKGYTWTSSNTGRARIESGALRISGEGRVKLTLTMAEAAYRSENGLPASDIELTKSYSFIVGDVEARLITDNVTVKYSDDAESVTASFYDNLSYFDDDWNGAAFTYEIRDAAETVVSGGSAEKIDGAVNVDLTFGGTTPKKVSTFKDGGYKPAYTITLTATAGMKSVSATSNVYIAPPPVTIECLTDPASVPAGSHVTYTYRIGNLVPGYDVEYSTSDGVIGPLTGGNEEEDPTTELITLSGATVVYNAPTPDDGSELYLLTVTASNPGQQSQSLTRRINVIDPDAGLIDVSFYDGLGGAPIDPEQGDAANEFYGLRESKIADLIGDYDQSSQQAVYNYVNQMIRPKTLSVTAPAAWGKMSADILSPTYNQTIPYALYRDQVGKEVTLTWENVQTEMKFTFRNDALSNKLYVFYLNNNLPGVPVSVSYKTKKGGAVQKDVTPYNGYMFLYEPDGIADSVWMLQSSGGDVRFATAYPSGLSLKRSIPGFYNAEMLLTTLGSQHSYFISEPGAAFYSRTVKMSDEPTVAFKPMYSLRSGAEIRYGVIDKDGKYVAGTGSSVQISSSGNPEFQVAFRAMYENPESRLLLEYQFDGGNAEPWAEYYDLATLDKAFRNRSAILYEYSAPRANKLYVTSPKAAVVKSPDGQAQSIDITSANKVLRLQSDDAVDLSVAAGRREISAATVTLKHYRTGDSMSEPRITTTAPVSVINAGDWSFTPNHYATLRFEPADYLTPGYFAQLVLQVQFTDGSNHSQALCYAMVDDNGSTIQNEQSILDTLKATDLFPTDKMRLRVKDADVKGHTANITVLDGYPLEEYRLSFDPQVAEVYDTIDARYTSITSKNPFTWSVERKGDEYFIRGYVYDRGEGMEDFRDPESKRDFDFYFNDIKANTDYCFTFRDTASSIPYLIGYLEGRATITADGEVRYTWNAGRMYAHNTYRTPQKDFKSSYFDWALILAGEVRTFIEIKAPDEGGDPTHPFNFNLRENSSTKIEAITGHNGQNLELGIYAQQEEIRGKAEAEVTQQAVYRPYLENGGPADKKIEFRTEGDLRLYRGYRVITDDTGMAESGETTIPLWCSSYWRRIYDVSGMNNDFLVGYYPQRWTVTIGGTAKNMASAQASPLASAKIQSTVMMSEAQKLYGMSMSGSSMPGTDMSAMGSSAASSSIARYYDFNNGAEILTPGSNGIPEASFSLDTASVEGSISVAAWGVYNVAYDEKVLYTFDEIRAQKYAAGMTEIEAGVYTGGVLDHVRLTNNSLVDITPKTASNGTNGIVVWYQGTADVVDGDSETEGIQPRISINDGRLMFSSYNGAVWSDPAVLYVSDSENIVDHSVAMANDGSAVVAAVTDSGRVAILRVENGVVTLTGQELAAGAQPDLTGIGPVLTPVFTKTSIVYNGADYTLACFDANNIALNLYELNTHGFVTDTVFSGVPANANGKFRLFRDWNTTGRGAVVLTWSGLVDGAEDSGENSIVTKEAVIYASRMSAEASGRVVICAPMTAFHEADVVYINSYDAYIKGNDISLLVLCKDKNTDGNRGVFENGNARNVEVQERFTNAVSTYPGVNDISALVPGTPAFLNIKVRNDGFKQIIGIAVQIDSGSSSQVLANLQPNDEMLASVPYYVPVRNLPESVAYTVTATFSDLSTDTASGIIDLMQTDIAAKILSFTHESNKIEIGALISNDTPFSMTGKTVVAGIYKDTFGTEPVAAEMTINGNEFDALTTGSTIGAAIAANFTLTGADTLPQTLYLIAKAYDSSNNEIPDSDSMNNILTIINFVPVSHTNTGGNGNGSGGGGGGAGGGAVPRDDKEDPKDPEDPKDTKDPKDPKDPPAQWSNPFKDVKKSDWFYKDVEFVYENGLFKGTGTDTFSPKASMTRAMLVTVLWRMSGSPSVSDSLFTDVADGLWYSEAVAWAWANGIVNGIGGGLFGPDEEITREQLATILFRYEQFSGKIPADIVTGKTMNDADAISKYAVEAVNALVAQGIITGKPGNIFDPKGAATRAEVAAMLHRFMTAVELLEQ